MAEWKWDGIRLQAVAGRDPQGKLVADLFPHRGGRVRRLPGPHEALDFEATLDGELLILRDGRVQSFNVLQQRLNRKAVTPRMLVEYPAHLRCYDMLVDGTEDIRHLPFRSAGRGSRLSSPA
jgi:DNA ligase-1